MAELAPARAVRPGQILDRELKARGWTQKDLAEIMDRPAQAINEIVAGAKQITPTTAHELAQVFGTSAELWMNLETAYRLHLASADISGAIARKSRLYSLAPVKELLRRMWIKSGDSLEEQEAAVCAFLEISGPAEQPAIAASRRHSSARVPEAAAQIAMVKRATHLARAQRLTGSYKRDKLLAGLPQLLALSGSLSGAAEIPSWFLRHGVHLVIVRQLPQSFLDGALFELPSGPVILLTLRYDRVDSFWFTLMHEVGHLVHGHGGVFLDNTDERKNDKAEVEADKFAKETLVGRDEYPAFVAGTKPFFSRAQIAAFAQRMGRHPGIVLGQLQHDGHVPYMNLRAMLEKVSPRLEEWIDRPAPGKMVTVGAG